MKPISSKPAKASRRVVVGSLSVLTSIIVLAVAWLGDGSKEVSGPLASRPVQPVESGSATGVFTTVERVDSIQSQRFALLRGRPEPLPRALRRVLRKPSFGGNWNLAQRLPTREGAYWIVPGSGHLCIVHRIPEDQSAATICMTTAQTLGHGIAEVTIASGSRTIVGMAPDRVAEVLVRTRGVTERSVVEHGVFVLHGEGSDPPDAIDVRFR